ncbi:MAG: Gfo/Idh/MocA family oxidoreductase [Acidimicrobiales bacterium]|nr:Gfo/Idh/MocA family oxidoreductase [Acidimicrobiales bacterium]
MADSLRAVVVGSSFGGRVHVPALRAAGFDVVGLVGHNADRTAGRAAALSIPSHGTSITDVIEATSADVATVSTPPAVHHESVLEVIGTGRHVLAEKPFALSVDEAVQMVDAAAAAQVTAMVSFEFRWQPAEALIARAIANGDIGEPRAANFVSHSGLVADGLPRAFNDEWWGDASAGGGILNAAGVHVLDRLLTWLGPVMSVSGSVTQVGTLEGGADDTYSALMRTAGGATISAQQCSGARGSGVSICKVIGTEGSIWLEAGAAMIATHGEPEAITVPEDLIPPPLPHYDSDDPKHAFTAFELPLFIRLAERLRDEITGAAIDATAPPTPTFTDGLATQQIIDAIRSSSAEGGRAVDLEPTTW